VLQLISPAALTVPAPAPMICTASGSEFKPNVAVTVDIASIVTVQAAVPLHGPDQPVKVEPESGDAVSVTVVP
jgi:hypothetical protein